MRVEPFGVQEQELAGRGERHRARALGGATCGRLDRLVCDRLDVSGARWGLDGAGHVLDLRALVITDSFQE